MENTRDITKECTQRNSAGTNKRIQILMSTYNGEKYLREQLDSFVNLDNFEEVKVLIRDDGSTDSTLEILDEYRLKYGFEIIKGINIGLNKSMMNLFKECDMECDYFAYSDQDDVWLSDKLILASNMLDKMPKEKPLLFSSCSEVVDQNLKFISNTDYPSRGTDFYNAMIQNIARGHTQVFNLEMVKEIRNKQFNIEEIYYIDWWIYLIATGIGKSIFSYEPTVKYRQHEENILGYKSNPISDLRKKITLVLRDECRAMANQLREFRNTYRNVLPYEFIDELNSYYDNQSSIIKRVKYVINTNVYRQSFLQTLAFKVLYVIGKYNN